MFDSKYEDVVTNWYSYGMVASLCEEVNEPAREVPRAMGMCFLIKLISYT